MNPYIASFAGTVVVMLLSLLSALLVCPLLEKPFTKHILSLLSMLAVGCLSGDAIFHLIPHAMKLNKPSPASHGSSHSKNTSTLLNSTMAANSSRPGIEYEDDTAIMWKGVVIIASLYSFYILNTITHFLKIPHVHGHSHSHTLHTTLVPMQKKDHPEKKSVTLTDYHTATKEDKTERNRHDPTWISEKCLLLQDEKAQQNARRYSTGMVPFDEEPQKSDPPQKSDLPQNRLPTVVWMILLGDVIHNITDGIAIGASFAGSFTGGISTSIAVLCHEIPHEIGDFVILINAGVNPYKSLLMTAATYMSAFVGNVVGVALGEELNIVEWIFAITAGMFLYIALVELLPDIIDDVEDDNERNWTSYICQNIGLIAGCAVMALIAAYEDSMKKLFS